MTFSPGNPLMRLQHNMLSALLLGVMLGIVGVGAAYFFAADPPVSSDATLAQNSDSYSPTIASNTTSLPPRSAAAKKPSAQPAPKQTREFAAPVQPRLATAAPAKPILAAARPMTDAETRAPVPSRASALVAIIIDDMGHSPKHSKAALTMPKEVAFALLPYARASRALAGKATARGHELIVHMPMQPKNTKQNPGPHVLKTAASRDDLRRAITWNLDQFEGFYAVNNHMGSAFTEDDEAMQVLFEELSLRGLAFYDSRTTAKSKAVDLAARYKVSMAERDVFLDNEIEASAVDKQLRQLERLAFRNGSAIAIGHPHTVTFDQISAWAETLEARGLRLVPPSEIARQRNTPYWRRIVKTAGRKALEDTAF